MDRKITIVVNGRFHAFDYAAELHKQGRLRRLVSTMPSFVARQYGLGSDVYVGLPVFEVIKRTWRKLAKRELPALGYARLFTGTARLFVPKDTEVVVCFAGYAKEIFDAPQCKKALKILDRGSTHTLSNREELQQAAVYHGTPWKLLPQTFVKRELEEYALADRILVPSSFVYRTFVEKGVSADKIWMIPYGASLQKFSGVQPVKADREPAVLYVGKISPLKGIGVLVKAMEKLRERIPDAQLWLVGARSPLMPEELLNKPWIKLWGTLHGQDLYDKYKRASVFCLPTFGDGFGLVLIEAIQCGLPVVTTPNSGGTDLVQEGPYLSIAPVGDSETTADRLIRHMERNDALPEFDEQNWPIPSWQSYTETLFTNLDNLSPHE